MADDATTTSSAAPTIKFRSAPKKRTILKVEDIIEDGADASNDATAADVRSKIEEAREIQKLRQRHSGVNVAEKVVEEETVVEVEEQPEEPNILSAKQFTQQKGQVETTDKNLEKWLAERLQKKDKDTESSPAAAVPARPEDELYKVPAHLQAKTRTEQESETTNWLTGLVEVALPIEYKLKNIEDTERAKRAAMLNGSDESQNMRSTGHHHGKRKEKHDRHKDAVATDTQVLERFKKRMRFNRR
eukprot:GILJ01005479.1.p1 GENE.GILJ01005479.1~~GILJ01005479.1.p1  ORF type:complete len:257 (+),score=49.19 GILJ01005479.1:39-773(+)